MENKEIISRIESRLGIDALNPMQTAIAQSDRKRFILLAPTGSGKTLAFTIALLKAMGDPQGRVQALVIAPSRELVTQISEVIRSVCAGKYKVAALYGGHSMADEVKTLSVTPDIVVATPGRLLDHIERKQIDIRGVITLVLDEYDKSLELGFLDEMKKIVKRISSPSNVILTSATQIEELPDFISLKGVKVYDFSEKTESPRERIEISLVESPDRDKIDTLKNLLRSLPNEKVIVFVNHRESAERVYEALGKTGLPVGLYHGGLDQQKREMALDMLDNGSTPILVSTDLGSRGLDIDKVGAVIHYHIPLSQESWTHRNGRTARMDATGHVYIIMSEADKKPDYVEWDNVFVPSGSSPDAIRSNVATLYINAGRKEKISRGDVAGYVSQALGVPGDKVGKIALKDHYTLVGIPRDMMKSIISLSPAPKIKKMRVRLSIVGG